MLIVGCHYQGCCTPIELPLYSIWQSIVLFLVPRELSSQSLAGLEVWDNKTVWLKGMAAKHYIIIHLHTLNLFYFYTTLQSCSRPPCQS